MTLEYIEGFETCIDKPDLSGRGWRMSAFAGYNGGNALTVPSRTGTPGKGLFLAGPYGSASNTYLPLSGTIDAGMLDTGVSINSLWNAGGFSVGFSATFNKGTTTQIAHNLMKQITYDGAQYYWAVGQVGSTWAVFYSTDLQNWTQTVATPVNAAADCTINVMGSGSSATIMIGTSLTSNYSSYYYSTNMGATWTAVAVVGSWTAKQPIATGNASTPIMYSASGASTQGVFYQSSASATPVQVAGVSIGASSTYNTGAAKLVNGIACFTAAGGGSQPSTPSAFSSFWQCCPVSKDMTQSANYVQSATLSGHQMVDITFFNNTWIAVGHGGIYTAPNSGTVAAPAGPTAAWANPLSGALIYSVDTNGSICVAVGQDTANSAIGAIYTSKDGVTWTKSNRFIYISGNSGTTNGNCFTNVIWDGSRFILTGGVNANVIATSTDGIAWTGMYYPDYTELAGTSSGSVLGVYSGTILAGTYTGGAQGGAGTFAPWNTSGSYMAGAGFNAGALSSGARTVQGYMVPGTGSTATVAAVSGASSSVSTTPQTHYYEIIATAVAGQTNQFTFQFAIDGTILPATSTAYYFASGTDTTGAAHLLINLPRSGNWTVLDDIYLTTKNGSHNVGQLGVVNVLPWTPASDATTPQFTQTTSTTSDAAAVSGTLSNSENSVYTTTVGAKDVYAMTNAVPAGYKVLGVQAEAYFSKYGTTGANGTVGIVSGSAESDSAQIAGTGSSATYGSLLLETDPNTGTTWTVAGAQAAEVAINKVT